jgi:hypothetical protein
MRVIVREIFSYASPERHPGEMQTYPYVIGELAQGIQILCDSQFPLDEPKPDFWRNPDSRRSYLKGV